MQSPRLPFTLLFRPSSTTHRLSLQYRHYAAGKKRTGLSDPTPASPKSRASNATGMPTDLESPSAAASIPSSPKSSTSQPQDAAIQRALAYEPPPPPDPTVPTSPEDLPVQGSLGPTSIFSSPDAGSEAHPTQRARKSNIHTSQVLDPVPQNRRRWERAQILKNLRTRGAMTRAEILKRTEREHLAKSHFFKTSYKKLMPLARQIRGMTIDDALQQMRFSKKRAAVEVHKQLIRARNEAIVHRGMGLNSGPVTSAAEQLESTKTGRPVLPAELVDQSSELYRKMNEPVPPEVKIKGKTKRIASPQTLYLSQVWINKGPDRTEMTKKSEALDFRARGKAYRLKRPTTSISFLVKEQRTLVREAAEKVEKRDLRKVWTQIPQESVRGQRQYPLW